MREQQELRQGLQTCLQLLEQELVRQIGHLVLEVVHQKDHRGPEQVRQKGHQALELALNQTDRLERE